MVRLRCEECSFVLDTHVASQRCRGMTHREPYYSPLSRCYLPPVWSVAQLDWLNYFQPLGHQGQAMGDCGRMQGQEKGVEGPWFIPLMSGLCLVLVVAVSICGPNSWQVPHPPVHLLPMPSSAPHYYCQSWWTSLPSWLLFLCLHAHAEAYTKYTQYNHLE